jgi:uncharacterized protein YjbI with pentapeptide repeats
MAVCRIHEKDSQIKCQRDAWERDPDDLCLLHSRQDDKDEDGKFTDAVKQKLEAEDYDFRKVFFPDFVDFSGREFNKRADFSSATFHKADFSRARFHEADFSHAIFQWGRFTLATFHEADFSGATFQVAHFFKTTFQDASFVATVFQEAHFSWAKINGLITLRFIMPLKPRRVSLPWSAKLISIQFGEKGGLRLEHLSLAKVQFTRTDLRRVEFDQVTWYRKFWRDVVYDEILLHRQRWAYITNVLNYGWLWGKRILSEKIRPKKPTYADFGTVERLYRQLKSNYNKEEDYKRVGDFHYGEMEMHRRSSFSRQWLPSWYNFYRVLSGYGERPLRAFIWLLLLIPAWAGLVWGLGIEQAGSQHPFSYRDTLLFVFEKVTFQRPALPGGLTWLGKFLSGLSVLLIPGQAALFILALRNRLGRRR